MGLQTVVRRAVLAVVVLGSLLASTGPARAAGYAVRAQAEPLPGVQVQGLSGDGLSLDVGRIAKGAPVRVEVIASGAVAGGVDTTSNVCRRAGAILCINGDFTECRECTTAFGGIIHDGAILRSPVSNHPQLWLGSGGPGAGPLGWGASLEATLTYLVPAPPVLGGLLPSGPPTSRTETVSLGLDAVNRGRGANQVVLYTPPWAATTTTPNGGDEAVLGGGAPTIGGTVPVSLGPWKGGAGNNAIPRDGMVLSASGAGSGRMRAFWNKAADPAAASRSVTLRATSERAVDESIGGHPVILANGQELIGHSRDPFATNRHPRTLVGWNPAGDLLLVTVDGRQGHSQGVSLLQATDVLRKLGATSGFNLDGGGSTTFVSMAPGGTAPQVLNRPSDGSERRITTVLAVVPVNASAVRSAAAPAPPQPPPAPPGPPPADEASTDGLPARPSTTVAPTTTAAPTTTLPPTTTTTTLPPVPVTEPFEPVAIEVAAPPPPPPARSSGPALGVPSAVAALAVAVAAAATARTARRRRRREPSVTSTAEPV